MAQRELGVRAVLPEVVTSSLRFSDVKRTGSYKSKGEPWMLKEREACPPPSHGARGPEHRSQEAVADGE